MRTNDPELARAILHEVRQINPTLAGNIAALDFQPNGFVEIYEREAGLVTGADMALFSLAYQSVFLANVSVVVDGPTPAHLRHVVD